MANTDNLIPFQPGQSGNPAGRPKGSTKAKLMRIFKEEMSEDDFRAIVRSRIKRAKAGDRFAADHIFLYMLGRPKPMDEDEGDSVQMLIQLLQPKPPEAIEVDAHAVADDD